jgi:AcrR family transcriptional regulator
MKKQPEITAQTRQNLIDAFWRLYCKKRIDKITVKEIAATAGYNRGTFYEYFVDVYDVLEQVETSLLPRMEDFPPIGFQSAGIPQPMEDFVKIYVEHSDYYTVLLGDNGDPSFLGKMKNGIKPKLRQMLVSKGAADDFDLDYTLEYILSAMIGILGYWFRQETVPPTQTLLHLMHELMHEGALKKLGGLSMTDPI